MKRIAICPGSFDPITKGHENIIERTSKMFDEVYVCVGINPNKKNQVFAPEERVKFINKVVAKYGNVKALSYDCLTIELAETLKACAIVKGLRNSIDFEDEMYQAEYNYNVNNSIETIFLISDEKLVNVSSTKVKELAANKDNIKDIIPIEIYEEVAAKLYKKK